MYSPPFNTMDDEDEIRAMVASVASGWFVTVADGIPQATLLPIIWRGGTVIAHIAKANPQWQSIHDEAPALLIVGGPEAYISPSWYAAKTEHGKVVPTWNYTAVHLSGTVRVRHDIEWIRAAVTDLTDLHERDRDAPWQVSDAPAAYVDGQLRGIVGLEVAVTRVEGKAKLSQNRSTADQLGVISGLGQQSDRGADEIRTAMVALETVPER